MARFNSGRFDSVRSKYTVMVFLICFCFIASLGSPLHAHDLESSHVDLDCISCHLVHANVGLDHDEPDLFLEAQKTQFVAIATAPLINHTLSSHSPRAPPIIC